MASARNATGIFVAGFVMMAFLGLAADAPKVRPKPPPPITVEQAAIACRKALVETKLIADSNAFGDDGSFTAFVPDPNGRIPPRSSFLVVRPQGFYQFYVDKLKDHQKGYIALPGATKEDFVVVDRFYSPTPSPTRHWFTIPPPMGFKRSHAMELKGTKVITKTLGNWIPATLQPMITESEFIKTAELIGSFRTSLGRIDGAKEEIKFIQNYTKEYGGVAKFIQLLAPCRSTVLWSEDRIPDPLESLERNLKGVE